MKRIVQATVLRVFAVVALTAVANAGTVVYDNTGGTSGGTDLVVGVGPLFNSFTSGFSGSITSLTFLLSGDPTDTGTTASSRTTSVDLYSDNSATPGALFSNLGTFNDSFLFNTISTLSLTLLHNPVVQGNTRYWIGLSSTDTTAGWAYTPDLSGIGVSSEYYSNNNGTSLNNPGGGYQMALELDPASPSGVPEPSTIGLCALALAGLAASRLRRRNG